MEKLQALRIPAGWEVVLNKFQEIDIEDCSMDDWIDKVILDENWVKPVMEYVN